MTDNEDLLMAVTELKKEVQQLREVVYILLNFMSEMEIEIEDDLDPMGFITKALDNNMNMYN